MVGRVLLICTHRYPDHPPLKVIYSHVAINDKLEVKMKSEEVRTTKLYVPIIAD